MRRFLSILFVLGLVVSFSLVTAVPAMAVPEVWVDDGFDSSTPGWGTTHFDTIQDGIDAADSPGGTVHVAAGYYTENVILADGVDVLGEGADVTTIDGGSDSSACVTANSIGSGTIFSGFTLTNGGATSGGGIYISTSSLTVTNCVITGNSALDGGGMYTDDSSPVVTNCVFENNTADWFGGGIHCFNNSHPDITNCTIVDNTASGANGGGIYLHNSSPNITNNIIVSNTANNGGGIYADTGASPTINYNDVWNNNPDNLVNCSGGTGALSVDPVFDDAQYHIIHPDSPCIDVGNNSAPSLPSTDFEGDPRIFDGDGDSTHTVDMGADEYYVAPPPPPPPPPSGTVGGTVYPIDKTAILLPWFSLGATLLLALSGGLFLSRRRSR